MITCQLDSVLLTEQARFVDLQTFFRNATFISPCSPQGLEHAYLRKFGFFCVSHKRAVHQPLINEFMKIKTVEQRRLKGTKQQQEHGA